MLFLATVISYIDRQTMAIAAPAIAKEFNLTNEEVGRILSSFLFAYGVGQLVAGRVLDLIGTRIGLALSIAWWSLANMLTAFVTRPWGFSFLRFMLGVGESGNFPGGVKVVAEWFPARERAFAGGLFTSGGSIGAIVAAPLVATLVHYWGWRVAFMATGGLGFIWLAGWLCLYDTPEKHPMLSSGERCLINNEGELLPIQKDVKWFDLLKFRQVWALTIARFLEEPLFWMILFWLPKYMVDVRGLSVLQTGWTLTIPFITLDVGYIGGGWLTSQLVARRWTIQRAKSVVMMCAAFLMIGTVLAIFSSSVGGFVCFLCLATLGHGSWVSNMVTIPSDMAPAKVVGSFYGISALGGGLGGMVFTEVTGIVADRYHSFIPVFVVSSFLPMLATVILILLSRRMEPLDLVTESKGLGS
jgi:ACS family hexuronate transporter-like MFS transporter